MSAPLKVFITYSHNDPEQNKELKTRLAVMEDEGKIEIWDDNIICSEEDLPIYRLITAFDADRRFVDEYDTRRGI